MEGRPGENGTMGKTKQLPLLEGEEEKRRLLPQSPAPGECKGGVPGQKGAENLPQARPPSGRRGEEHNRSPQLAPAATYPRVAALGPARSFP